MDVKFSITLDNGVKGDVTVKNFTWKDKTANGTSDRDALALKAWKVACQNGGIRKAKTISQAEKLANQWIYGVRQRTVQVVEKEVPVQVTPEQIEQFNLSEDQLRQMLEAGIIQAETATA